MPVVKSFAVGNGDMYYINHANGTLTVIDCCLSDENEARILGEIKQIKDDSAVTRFISTHPDDDHLRGLDIFESKIGVGNFYCVDNATEKEDETDCFTSYCHLRDHEKTYRLHKGCTRRWLNEGNDERHGAGVHVYWPDVDNEHYKEALKAAAEGGSPNNISAIIRYGAGDASFLWMGDLETEFMEEIAGELEIPATDIVFAPHHGRESGRIPDAVLAKLNPKIIIVGEAPSEHLHYYPDYNTITQNSAGDILFHCDGKKVHICTSNDYEVDFLDNESRVLKGMYYIGTLNV